MRNGQLIGDIEWRFLFIIWLQKKYSAAKENWIFRLLTRLLINAYILLDIHETFINQRLLKFQPCNHIEADGLLLLNYQLNAANKESTVNMIKMHNFLKNKTLYKYNITRSIGSAFSQCTVEAKNHKSKAKPEEIANEHKIDSIHSVDKVLVLLF